MFTFCSLTDTLTEKNIYRIAAEVSNVLKSTNERMRIKKHNLLLNDVTLLKKKLN